MMVWISSMNRIAPSCLRIAASTAFRRFSKSPRYLVPATSAPRSSEKIVASSSTSGTSPSTMRLASPSAIAVLPTPASPTYSGLFLRRRHSTWIVRSISSPRPTSGSILPCRAMSLRSTA